MSWWDDVPLWLSILSGTTAWVTFFAGAFAVFFGPRNARIATLCYLLSSAYIIIAVTSTTMFNVQSIWLSPGPVRSTIVSAFLFAGFMCSIYQGLRRKHRKRGDHTC